MSKTTKTPSNSDKKRNASSPLDSVDLKKRRTVSVGSADSVDQSASETMQINLDDAALEKIADYLSDKFEAKLFSRLGGIQTKEVSLENENAELKDRVAKLEQQLEYQEKRGDEAAQYGGRNCLRISGIKEDEESLDDIVKNLSTELKADLDLRDIDNMHRLGKRKTPAEKRAGANRSTPARPRDVIIKFTSYRARNKVLANRRL